MNSFHKSLLQVRRATVLYKALCSANPRLSSHAGLESTNEVLRYSLASFLSLVSYVSQVTSHTLSYHVFKRRPGRWIPSYRRPGMIHGWALLEVTCLCRATSDWTTGLRRPACRSTWVSSLYDTFMTPSSFPLAVIFSPTWFNTSRLLFSSPVWNVSFL